MGLHVLGPARIVLFDAIAGIGRSAQQADELVIIEVDDLGARHASILSLKLPRKYLKVADNASHERPIRRLARLANHGWPAPVQVDSSRRREPQPQTDGTED